MAIFGFKKRKDEKLEQSAAAAKSAAAKSKVKSQKSEVQSRKYDAKGSKGEVLDVKLAPKGTKLEAERKVVAIPLASFSGASEAIIRPRVTEKSGILSQGGCYTFEVIADANKQSIANAVNTLYKVKPIKVTVINTPTKNVFVKGRKGTVSGIKKAIVTLKKGEKIDFV